MEKRSGPASVASGQTQTADLEVILNRVTCAIDALVREAVPYGGLLPSFWDRRTGAMPDEHTPPIPGQRAGDRAFPGNNLMHDVSLLGTKYGPTRLSLRAREGAACPLPPDYTAQ